MSEAIDYLEARGDVAKTEYSYYDDDGDVQVTIEMWHDTDQLQSLFQRAMNIDVTKQGLQKMAKERAIAVRTTRETLDALYPELVEQFEDES